MDTLTVRALAAVAALLAGAAAPGMAAAQDCVGAPVRGGTHVAIAEVARNADVTTYGTRLGRGFGDALAAHLDLARVALPPTEWNRGGDGTRLGATVVLNLETVALPLCSFMTLRHVQVSREFSFEDWNGAGPGVWTSEVAGLSAFAGMAAAAEIDVGRSWTLSPSASVALGWMRNANGGRCVQGCDVGHPAYPTMIESGFQVEAETGFIARSGRLFAGAGLRWVVGEFDPVMQQNPFSGVHPLTLPTARIGVTF